ncbi:AAA family ATPase [Methylobacterium sp. J-026]|uniref:AAA family ATPase n=1 Tax=Methylobacterium sp. J-026 TaxID=2836624 RepID=UPI00391D2C56
MGRFLVKRISAVDRQRALAKRTFKQCPVIVKLSIHDHREFEDVELNLNSGFIALCGGSGVGKSSILEILNCLLISSADLDARGLNADSAALNHQYVSSTKTTYSITI